VDDDIDADGIQLLVVHIDKKVRDELRDYILCKDDGASRRVLRS
jgi:hypothetical protein